MPLTILPVSLPLTYGTDGPAVDISAFNDEKTILVIDLHRAAVHVQPVLPSHRRGRHPHPGG